MLRVLTLATLFPDATRPRLGPFVDRQTRELAVHPDVELQVVAPRGLPPWPLDRHAHYRGFSNLPAHEEWNGLTVHRPRFTHLPATQGRFDASAIVRALSSLLARIRRDFAFDVIDAEFFFPDGPAAVPLGRAFDVPVSIKARGGDIHLWGRAPATRAQIVTAGRSADGLLAVSDALKADMIALGMPGKHITVHRTGVDLENFVPRDPGAAKAWAGVSGPLIVTVGALTVRKGQALAIEALKDLPGVTLALIGDGPDRARLAKLAREAGLADRVRFTGSINHEEIARWLAAADVMVLPSASEGLANAWVEALACGTPVVTTDVGGARELITAPEAGRIVSAEPAAIAAAVRELLDRPPAREAVRAFALPYTWKRNRDALYAHLAGLVSAYSPRRI